MMFIRGTSCPPLFASDESVKSVINYSISVDSVCSVDYLFSTEDTEGHGFTRLVKVWLLTQASQFVAMLQCCIYNMLFHLKTLLLQIFAWSHSIFRFEVHRETLQGIEAYGVGNLCNLHL